MSEQRNAVIASADEELSNLLVDAFERNGFPTSVARRADRAGQLLAKGAAVAVVDWRLTKPDALDVCRYARASEGCLVVAVVEPEHGGQAAEAVDLGASQILTLPLAPPMAQQCVRLAQRLSALTRDHRSLENESRLHRRLLSGVAVVVWRMSLPSLHFEYVSPASRRLAGRGNKVRRLSDLFPPLHETKLRRTLADAIATYEQTGVRPSLSIDLQQYVGDTGRCWVRINATLDCDENNHPVAVQGVTVDITEGKHAEMRVKESEERYRSLVELAPDAIVVHRDGLILFANSAGVKLFAAADSAELIGRPLDEFFLPARGQGGTPKLRRLDGVVVDVDVSEASILFRDAPAMHAIIRDRTERAKLESQLFLTDRMVSMGTMAAGVAHEINNPLAYILANLDFIHGELNQPDTSGINTADVSEAVDDALEGANRVRHIVQDLKTFSRGDDRHVGAVNPVRVLESAISMAWNEIRHRAELVRDVADVSLVRANESRLSQVFLNLLVNAAQSIPSGDAANNRISVRLRDRDDGCVEMQVSDTGCGMDDQLLKRIFEPFYTTKPIGVGTGLGLSICRSIIESFDGEISVESALGEGTTFTVVLPGTVEQPAKEPAAVAVAER